MNEKQKKFALYYVQHENAAKAARQAGYSKRTCGTIGSQLKRHPQVKAEIARLREEVADRNDIDVDKVVQMHVNVYHGACADGKWGDANKAAEALGRFLGMDQSKKKHVNFGFFSQQQNVDADMDRLARIAGVELTTSSGGRA